jgi:hypothetical protein
MHIPDLIGLQDEIEEDEARSRTAAGGCDPCNYIGT